MARTTTSARSAPGWIETFLRPSDPAAMARRSELIGVIVVGLAAAFGAALWTYDAADMDVVHAGQGATQPINNWIGPVGARIADILLHLFGVFAYVINGFLMMIGLRTVLGRSILPRLGTFNGVLGVTVATMIVMHLWTRAIDLRPHGKDAAGLFGSAVTEFLRAFLSSTGSLIVALVLLATAVSALAGRPIIRDALIALAERFGWLKSRAATATESASEQLDGWKKRRAARREIEESAKHEAVPAVVPDVFAEEIAREQTAIRTARSEDIALDEDEIHTDPNALKPAVLFSRDALPQTDPVVPPPVTPRTRVSKPNPRVSKSNHVAETAPEFPQGTQLRPNKMQVPTGVRRAKARVSASDIPTPPDNIAGDESTTAQFDVPTDRDNHAVVEAPLPPPPVATYAQKARKDGKIDDLTPLPISAIEPVDNPADARPAVLGSQSESQGTSFTPHIVQTEAVKGFERITLGDEPEQGKLAIDQKKSWRMPRKSMLEDPPPREIDLDHDVLAQNAMTLLEKLHDFKIDGSIENIRPGPVVTTYELKPAKGVRVNKITGLRDDLTMSLAAENVRVVAPIPGKDVVGIEVPNEQRQIVYFREVVESAVWQRSKSPLTIVLGKDIEGAPVVADLAKAPHLLVAGATGQGKSVGVNSMICSMLYKASPDDVKFIFIDPKVIELSVYEGIPHLLLPVLSDPDKATLALKWAVREMERRYQILHDAQVRNLDGYKAKLPKLKMQAKTKKVRVRNGKKELVDMNAPGAENLDHPPEPENIPKIVIVIDEFADLILNTGKDVEVAVSRLAAKARACGIHIILATQRPDTKVITGTIKANFPSRVAFKVSTKVDSGVVLDQSGAETLLGKGDMLFWPAGKDIVRCHGTFVSDDEVIATADHWKAQGEPVYDMEILKDPEAEDIEIVPDDQLDKVFWDAVQIAIDAQQASVSFLQRKLKIGYQRSARIIDQMEARGIVGPSTGANRPREILDYNPSMPSGVHRRIPHAEA